MLYVRLYIIMFFGASVLYETQSQSQNIPDPTNQINFAIKTPFEPKYVNVIKNDTIANKYTSITKK